MSKKNIPDFSEEALLWTQGSALVFGIDEAGRGCLAGPVCAAVSAWKPQAATQTFPFLRDSKVMTEKQREHAFPLVQEQAIFFGVGFATAKEIDQWNILRATFLAVARAMEIALVKVGEQSRQLLTSPIAVLSDGSHPLLSKARFFVFSDQYRDEFPRLRELMNRGLTEKCVVKGDSKVASISGASILAKVSRDHWMKKLDVSFPAFEFALHKGYSTPRHVELLQQEGPCIEHRRSFSPVAEAARAFGVK